MSEDKDGGSFWPINSHVGCIPGEGCRNHPGLTLRDHFATFAPRAPKWWLDIQTASDRNKNPHNEARFPPVRSYVELQAAWRYNWADVMLSARKGTG